MFCEKRGAVVQWISEETVRSIRHTVSPGEKIPKSRCFCENIECHSLFVFVFGVICNDLSSKFWCEYAGQVFYVKTPDWIVDNNRGVCSWIGSTHRSKVHLILEIFLSVQLVVIVFFYFCFIFSTSNFQTVPQYFLQRKAHSPLRKWYHWNFT